MLAACCANSGFASIDVAARSDQQLASLIRADIVRALVVSFVIHSRELLEEKANPILDVLHRNLLLAAGTDIRC